MSGFTKWTCSIENEQEESRKKMSMFPWATPGHYFPSIVIYAGPNLTSEVTSTPSRGN